jgi:hypothetical protein
MKYQYSNSVQITLHFNSAVSAEKSTGSVSDELV